MENEQMKFDFQTQSQSDMNELLRLMKLLDNLKVNLEEIIKKHENAEKQAESDLAVEKAYEMFVKKEESPKLDACFDQECPVDEKVFDEEQTVDDFSILNIIPEQARKWVERLTVGEMIQAITDADKSEGYESEDEYVGQLVDNLKDMAIAKYTNDILEGRITKIDDEEIRSEVVDYMKSKKMNIPETIEPVKKQLTVEEIISKLDKGEELELEKDILNKVVTILWTRRDNVSIEIRDNKIRLR